MNPIGYWTGARPGTTDAEILEKLESLYGCYLQELTRDDKASLLICLVEASVNPRQILTEPNFFTSENGGDAWLLIQKLSVPQQLGLSVAIAYQLLHGGQN